MKEQVFISYAKEDKVFADRLYKDLEKAGIKAWLNAKNLIPGQNWEMAITKAIKESRYFIALLSTHSVRKKGYVQKEIRQALRVAQEFPPDKIYIIPLRIDACKTNYEDINSLVIADLFPNYDLSFKELLRVFQYESMEKKTIFKTDHFFRKGLISRIMDKGFGFIEYDDIEYFFHMSELTNITLNELNKGDSIMFKMAEGPKGLIATLVKKE